MAVGPILSGIVTDLLISNLEILFQNEGVVNVLPVRARIFGIVDRDAVVHGDKAAVIHAEMLFRLAAVFLHFSEYRCFFGRGVFIYGVFSCEIGAFLQGCRWGFRTLGEDAGRKHLDQHCCNEKHCKDSFQMFHIYFPF